MAKEKILIIEDEQHIQELLTYNLQQREYKVVNLLDGTRAIETIEREKPDLILLDIMLPGKDGIEICKELKRKRESENIPIIMLTARGEEFDKVLGLEIGADDYITKPFSIKELIARVRAILRRMSSKTTYPKTILQIGDIIIDNERYEVFKNNKRIELTLKEFELLKLLAENKGKVLTREFLLNKIWGYEYGGETRTVDVHIRHLRKKLEDDDKEPRYIETIRGVGYRITE
ncbi:response regulator transcription factor [Garciella nitratireducens]|uniref:Stage 0 sporulation protein A homolog n=1 Tax=Garciella nitratireducens DSM 15102 TaxID=1121911 RepID=A0A1T4K0F9_9FIRM|nr:response regulator transcription factor [Garciella nitratireducens]SJZ35966.1 two-component system, OmpR family, alkaline phosphatase synthesis response regulator PhoP [Garciella nitratireducens DSM 15102]